jgi:hypothetical protein
VKLPKTKEMQEHFDALRESKHLHPDELRFLMEHGAQFPPKKPTMTYQLLMDLVRLFELEAEHCNSGAEYCRLIDISIELRGKAHKAYEQESMAEGVDA